MLNLFKKDGRKKMISVAAACALIISNVTYLQNNHYVVSAASGEYKSWKQSDSRWSGIYLGGSRETIAQSGCAVTSLAALIVQAGYFDEATFTPGTFCTFMNNNGGLDSYGGIHWGTVSKLVPDFTFEGTAYLYGSTESEKAAEIKSYLDQGYYLITDVRYSSHWVAIDTVSDGIVYSIDPAAYTTNNLFDQYNFKGTTRLKLFKSGSSSKPSVPQENATNTVYEAGSYVTTAKLNVRSSPSVSADKLDLLEQNTKIQVTEVSGNWGKITVNNQTGWICLNYASMIQNTEEPATQYSTGTYTTSYVLNYRKEPSKSSETNGLIPAGTTLSVTQISDNWGKTVYNNKTSWVCLEYAQLINSELPADISELEQNDAVNLNQKYITSDPLNLRVSAGTGNTVLSVIPADTEVLVSEISDNWGKISFNSMVGWICLDFAKCANSQPEAAPVAPSDTIPEAAAPVATSEPTPDAIAPVVTSEPTPEATAPVVTSEPVPDAAAPVASSEPTPEAITPVVTSESVPDAAAPVASSEPTPKATTPIIADNTLPKVTESLTPTPIITGDINKDGKINAADLVLLIDYIINEGKGAPVPDSADVNGDSIISIFDIISLKFILLS